MELKRTDGLDAFVPCVRPHYEIRGNQLFFLISRRPTAQLSEKDLEIWSRIDGAKTVAGIAHGDPNVTERIREWHAADILELIPPMAERGPSSPHIVVIEPHMDDAALSVGGRMLRLRGRCRFTILTVMRHSNFTSYWDLRRNFLDVETVTALRLQESELAARLLGAGYRCLDWTDAPLRLFPEERWSFENMERIVPAVYRYKEIATDPREISELKEKLRSALEDLSPDEIWFPLGLSTHLDHRIVRGACISLLAEADGGIAKASACLYEDLPHGNPSLGLQIRKSFEDHGTVLRRLTEDVTDVFDGKLRAISAYASQFKRSYMEPQIRSAAGRGDHGAEGRLEEIFYRIEGRVAAPPESEMAPNREALEAMRPKARSLSADPGRYRRVAILVAPSGNLGRWRTDCDRILGIFQNSGIRLVLPGDMSWQVQDPAHGRIEVVRVGKGFLPWFLQSLKALVRPKTIALILWWGAGRNVAGPKGFLVKFVSSVFPRAMFSDSIGDLCLLMEEEKRNPS
ncbi:MAG: hypothetical protein H6Q84_2034 [Deltaproteobacteria bacterium]|nr:hypothetical protein [Deltaproteobacteria bacterium]